MPLSCGNEKSGYKLQAEIRRVVGRSLRVAIYMASSGTANGRSRVHVVHYLLYGQTPPLLFGQQSAIRDFLKTAASWLFNGQRQHTKREPVGQVLSRVADRAQPTP